MVYIVSFRPYGLESSGFRESQNLGMGFKVWGLKERV